MTFEQYKTIINAYLDFYPDDKVDVQVKDIYGLKTCLDKDANGEEITDEDKSKISDYNPLSIIVYHPQITLTNDAGKQYTIYDIYVETDFPDCNINMGRTTYNSKEVAVGYRHSHITSVNRTRGTRFSDMSSFCRGNDDTPINRIINMLKGETYSSFEYCIQSLIIETERMIKIESNAGMPYISFEQVGQSKSFIPINVRPYTPYISSYPLRDKIRDFVLYYCSLGLDEFYYDGRNWQLKATDAEFIKRVSHVAQIYKKTKNLSIFDTVYCINGLYYTKERSKNYIDNGTRASWMFKGEYPLLKVTDRDNVKVETASILKQEYLNIVYDYLLNLINGVYANTEKYKDSIHSRAYKIKTALIKECGGKD